MSYKEAMEQAGATVHEFAAFGSYQGDWYALVTWNGEKGLGAGILRVVFGVRCL